MSVQLAEDTPEHYKSQMQSYQIKEVPMFYEFEEHAHELEGGLCEADVHKYGHVYHKDTWI